MTTALQEDEVNEARTTVTDLSELDVSTPAARGAECQLRHPSTGAPLYDANGDKIFIAVLGEDAPKVKAADREATDANLDDARRRQKFTSAKQDSAARTRMVVATVRWNLFPVDGVVLDCTEKNARMLYGDKRFPWVAEQLDAFMKDRANFFAPGSTR